VVTVSDDFNRADGAVGASWTALIGTWAIATNKCRCTTIGGTFGYYLRYDTDVGSADMYAQAVTSSSQTDPFDNTGILVRGATGATQQSYQFATNHNSNTASFWRLVPGTETQLRLAGNSGTGSPELTVAIASGDTLRLEITGSLLRGKVNGALVACTRDTTITTGQRGGLNAYNNTAAHFSEQDNFQAGPLDDLVAPYVAGISAQVTGTAATLTPTEPVGLVAGDCLLAWVTAKDAAQTVTAPAGEGWSLVQNPSQTGLEGFLFAKVWGTGSTDDTTPTFTIGSGTGGWCMTLANVRNPAHASTPWTTVASAIVASGSQSNAASATVTAPSVTDTGTHRTVTRFFSSADDNVLGLSGSATTNSEGALIFGGADYDVTTVNGIAQAMSAREDFTTAGSTGTATVTETAVGNDINNGVTLVFAIPSAAAVNAVLAAPLGGVAAAGATPDHPAVLAAPLGGVATVAVTVSHPATFTAAAGGVAAAGATPNHPAVLAAPLGGVAALAAAPDRPAVLTSGFGGSAAASATPNHPAVLAASLGGVGALAAASDRPAVLTSGFGGVGTATATPNHPAVLAAPLGGVAALAAASDRPAVLAAPLGGVAALAATPDVPAVLSVPLGGVATATATADHAAVLSAAFGGNAALLAASVRSATLDAPLGGTGSALATPEPSAALAANLGGLSTSSATVERAAVLAAGFGGAATSTATTTHTAALAADMGGVAAAAATTGSVFDAALGGIAAVAATRGTFATAVADLAGTAAAIAAPGLTATAAAALGGGAAAIATPQVEAAATAAFGFDAEAGATTAGGVSAVLAGPLGGTTAAATAVVAHSANSVVDLAGIAALAADVTSPAAFAAVFGGTTAAVANIEHSAIAAALAGFTATTTAGIPPNADPAVITFSGTGSVGFSETGTVVSESTSGPTFSETCVTFQEAGQ